MKNSFVMISQRIGRSNRVLLLLAAIISCKVADLNQTDMISDNPFFQRIHAEGDELNNYEPISAQDEETYYLRGQNYKFSQPHKFVFIDLPVEFIAVEVDDEQNVKSMLLYLTRHERVLETLQVAYGKADISLDMKGQGEHKEGSEPYSYTSYTWIEGNYRLTFSVLPLKTNRGALRSQLFIQQ